MGVVWAIGVGVESALVLGWGCADVEGWICADVEGCTGAGDGVFWVNGAGSTRLLECVLGAAGGALKVLYPPTGPLNVFDAVS